MAKKKPAKKPTKKKSQQQDTMGKILSLLGVKAKKLPTATEEQIAKRQESLKGAYRFMRDRIDAGCAEYFRTEDLTALQQHVGGPAYKALVEHLGRLRAAGIVWVQPDRQVRTNDRLEVISEKLTSKGTVERFVIEERFNDNSIYRDSAGSDRQADGRERVIQATVEVKGGEHYKLLSVLEIKGATLEG